MVRSVHGRSLRVIEEVLVSLLLLFTGIALTPLIRSLQPILSFQPWDWISTILLILLFILAIRWYDPILFTLLFLTSILLGMILKILFHVPRPLPVLPDYGLPSLHALLAVLLALSLPESSSLALLLAGSVLVLRMAIGAHSLLDVIVGGLIGWQIALLIRQVHRVRGEGV